MKLFLWMKKEFFHILPVFIFFFIAFNIISSTERLVLERAGIAPISFWEVTIAAALVAKVFLVIDHLSLERMFPRRRPLIFRVAGKALLYCVITLVVRRLLQFTHYLWTGQGLAAAWSAFLAHIDWALLPIVETWYFLLFLLFIAARELTAIIGYARMRQIFFGK
jgi:hypothetical protein